MPSQWGHVGTMLNGKSLVRTDGIVFAQKQRGGGPPSSVPSSLEVGWSSGAMLGKKGLLLQHCCTAEVACTMHDA